MAKRVASQPLDLTESDDELNEVMDFYESARLADGPLFAIQFNPIGARRRWRNVVIGQQFNAVIRQLRPPAPEDNLGRALIDAFLRAIQTELESLDTRGEDRVNFTLQAPGFIHAYQSINFRVEEIVQRSPRLEELLHQLAAKLNSNEALNIQEGLQATFNLVRMPQRGGRGKRTNPGNKCLNEVNKRKRCIIPIRNDDELCCARAIVTMRAHCHRGEGGAEASDWNNLCNGRPLQGILADTLHRQAGVPSGPCGYEELQQFQDALGPHYQLLVMCRAKPFMLIFKGPEAPHQIRLLKSDHHYDGCTSFPGFVNRSYYCTLCEKGYNVEDAEHHPCEGRVCRGCQRADCPDYRRGQRPHEECPLCHCLFYGADCLRHHTSIGRCQKIKTCLSCKAKYTVNKRKPHRCGFAQCPCCSEMVKISDHKCYIQPINPEEDTSFETMAEWRAARRQAEVQNKKVPPPPPLLVYADIEALQLPDRTFQPILLCYKADDDYRIRDLYGDDCCLRFLHALDDMTQIPDYEEDRPVIVVFHNLKGFDGMFILNTLYAQQRTVQTQLTVGAKVLSFQSGALTFKDSLCFLPMPLASFPATFGLTELKKGFFPHVFNTLDNQSYEGRLPDLHYYDPESMSEGKRKELEEWYAHESARNAPFNLRQEMIDYCRSDVELLQAGCDAFITEFKAIAGFKPLEKCVTIASACNEYWRRHHLQPDTIAVEPLRGWRGANVNQSLKALQWLYFLNHQLRSDDDVADPIRHVRNGGEQQITTPASTYFVDGFDPSTQTIYEFHGCYWHACPTCHPYERHVTRPAQGNRTLEEVYRATLHKTAMLRQTGYRVVEIWECHWDDAVKQKNSPEALFVSTFDLAPPLQPRDAFFGGRTGAVALHAQADTAQGEEIRYVDVTSLYPWVNKTACYPVGHPTIITDPGHTDISQYFGMALVDLLPPPGLHHPVLPVRSGGKLTFPLCSRCVTEGQAKPMLERSSHCPHTDTVRGIRGTWCTPEIAVAVQKGYRITKIHEVWHFPPEQRVTGLFAAYVNTWLKIKQEASGWPRWCNTEEKKQQYIRNYHEREGILLEYDKIKKNPGLKALAKLMLNSFWGKFGEKQNKPTTVTIARPHVLFDLLNDSTCQVSTLRVCTDDILEAVYTRIDEDAQPSQKTNIFVAAFTTCWARLKLYSYLDQLQEQVLYYDTDSVIYRWREGQPSIPLGDYLGDMTDELDGDTITEFVSGGAKNYGYTTSSGKTECKVRGFTLNVRGSAVLNYQSMKNNILSELEAPLEERRNLLVSIPNHFHRDNTNKRIRLTERVKRYGLVFDKRVIDPLSKVSLPYGFHRITDDELDTEDEAMAELLCEL